MMRIRTAAAWTVAALLVVGLGSQPLSPPGVGPDAATTSSISAHEVVRRMMAMDASRQAALQSYTAVRHYHLEYDGLGHDVADMVVRVAYDAPGPKRLTVVSESGSGMLRHHVLDPLVKAERQEAEIENTSGSVFVPQNYSFTLVDYPHPGGQPDYVLAIKPRHSAQDRFVFQGKIWLDPVDFGLVRAEGRSVHSPSWWVTHFDFAYHGQKIGEFWLPASNQTVSHLRLFGHAMLNISYSGFKLVSYSPVQFLAQGPAQGPDQ